MLLAFWGTPLPIFAQSKDSPVTFGGYLDLYDMYDFNKPHLDVNDRLFDIKHNAPTLAEADFDILKAPSARAPFGFTINLIAGRSADLLHATEPGGINRYRYIGQAYATYVTPGRTPLTIDAGEFYSWVGYEGYDSRTQDNYSRSFENTLDQPDYHLGVRLTYPLSSKLSANLYGVNGWNEFQSSHHGKSWGVTLCYTPNDKWMLTLQNYDGPEGSDTVNDSGSYGGIGLPNPGVLRVHLLDAIVSYQPTTSWKFVFNGDYADAAGPGGGHWDGATFYAKKQLSKLTSATLRIERVHDTDGLRTGSPVLLHSVTLTYDVNATRYLLLRFEAREDFANVDTFVSENGPKKQRSTLTAACILHF